MKFEIDVNIPEGYEPTGEYRPVKLGEWYWGGTDRPEQGNNHGPVGHRLILREKPLAYEDFGERFGVRCQSGYSFPIGFASDRVTSDRAREIAAALIAAADHVDRVNAQRERS